MRSRRSLLCLGVLAATVACASAPTPSAPGPEAATAKSPDPRRAAVEQALGMIGAPYRYGGRSPEGFDCSGLVVYSYARAGVSGLPRSAAALERVAEPISLDDVEPGDLLFFRMGGKKTSHVAIYAGDRSFVHAPSSGKRVERVSFDHVYWSKHLGRAGRLGR